MAEAKPKITLYWLDKSRAHRILWLFEELNVEYEIKFYKRGKNMLAPKELQEIHPLGKSPVISVEVPGREKPIVIAESGNIVEFICEHYGKSWIPQKYVAGKEGQIGGESESWLRYRHLMHFTEGTLMIFLVLALVVTQLKDAPGIPFFIKPIPRAVGTQIEKQFLTRNLVSNFKFLEEQLASSPDGGDYFCGKEPTGADVMLCYPLEAAMAGRAGITRESHPNIAAWIDRVNQREAYQRAIKKSEEVTGEKFSFVP